MRKITIIILFLFCFLSRSYAQWQQMNGPNNEAHITAIVNLDSEVVASSSFCGIFICSSKFEKWQRISDDFFTCYFLVGDSLFYFSDKDRKVKLLYIKDNSISIVAYGPNPVEFKPFGYFGKQFFIGDEYTGFYISKDFGKTWVNSNNGLPKEDFTIPHGGGNVTWHHVYSVASSDKYVFAGTDKGVYRSNDDSISWIEKSKGLPKAQIDLLKAYSNEIYASVGKILYKSVDTGDTWSIFYTAGSNILSISKIDSILYIGIKNSGVYLFSDKSQKWSSISKGLSDKNVIDVKKVDSILICVTDSRGVFSFENNLWVQKIDGMTCSFVANLRTTNNFIFSSSGNDINISTDKQNWNNITPKDSIPTYTSSTWLFDDKLMYSYTFTDPNTLKLVTKYVYSQDYGKTWKDRSNLLIKWPPDAAAHLTRKGGRLFSENAGVPIYSDDSGASWLNFTNPVANCTPSIVMDGPNYYIVSCDNLYSFDDSFNYELAFELTDSRVKGGAFFLLSGVLFASNNLAHLYCSLDSGKTWFDANKNIESINQLYGFINDKKTFFISTNKGIFATKNYGKDWQHIDDTTIGIEIFEIAINNDTLYAATGGKGVWKRPLKSIYLGFNDEPLYQKAISLYPNPAQSSITIHSETELNSASIMLYDLQGQLLQHYSNINQKTFLIPRNNLPSGLYILKVVDGKNENFISKVNWQ